MFKLLSSGLVVFAGVACAPAGVAPLRLVQPPEVHRDARLETLRGFFERTGCPARDYSQVFLDAADDYRLDWRLLPGIAVIESTCGKAAPHNNIFGWANGKSRFSSPTAAIWGVARQFGESRLYRHRSLNRLLAIYNHNPAYAAKVKDVMQRIASVQ
jgi:hypothetical protein